MKQLDLKNKKFCIFGVQGSGKTVLAKRLCKNFKKPLIYDNHLDFEDVNRALIYKPDQLTMDEYSNFCYKVKRMGMNGRIDAFITDDADTYFRSSYHLYPTVLDLNANHRHYKIAYGLISRRPQDIPTKIVESSHFIFIFKLEGVNAKKKFKNIHPKIPELLEQLEYEKHNFVMKELGKEPKLMNPIKLKKK